MLRDARLLQATSRVVLSSALARPFDRLLAQLRSNLRHRRWSSSERASRRMRTPKPASPEVVVLLNKFISQSPRPLTLSRLLSFGHPLTSRSILSSASYALSEIPRRLTTRIRALENLPFIVGTNPYIARALEAHRTSFEWLATYPEVNSLKENADFAAQLEYLVQSHSNDIPTLAKGFVIICSIYCQPYSDIIRFQECSRYMSQTAISDFLDSAIRNRIAVRLIAEQHIALSQALGESPSCGSHDGVVNMSCLPVDMVRACSIIVNEMCEATFGAHPEVVIDGHLGSTFASVLPIDHTFTVDIRIHTRNADMYPSIFSTY